ncbi:Hypothetical predicted protein [Marmota monax]|uniref:Uncharacterized protein n=1 Tax=Marmota monax TaxID=9995 RepID=A0A5E4BMJ3_MARMO|nr:Hypothetical predicted protein [Marmota monax]
MATWFPGQQDRPRPLAAARGTAPPLSALPLQVQSEIRRGWHHCRLRRSLGKEQRPKLPEPPSRALPSGSDRGEIRVGSALSLGALPGPRDEGSRVLESYC